MLTRTIISRRIFKFISVNLVLVSCALLFAVSAVAAPLKNVPLQYRQPDGTTVSVLVSGDEYHRRVHDYRNFTAVVDKSSNWLVYADVIDDRLLPTFLTVGIDDPAAAGLVPGIDEAPAQIENKTWAKRALRTKRQAAPTTGAVNNLFIFIRFADDEVLLEEYAQYDAQFNSEVPESASMFNYFREISQDTLDVKTVFTPPPDGKWMTAWTSPNKRGYYRPYDAVYNPTGYTSDNEAQLREHAMLKDALAFVEADIPEGIDLDADDDGFVDNVIFMVQGWPDAWADLLWPHMWEFFEDVKIGDLSVKTYNLQLSVLMLISPGTFVHEMYHSLGSPDLYHYSQDGRDPVGPWCVMASTGMMAAQHPLAYMKWQYGAWVDDIPEVTENTEVTLFPSWDKGTQAVRVAVPESTDEYFVMEYRKAEGKFESSLPASGLIVYRINTTVEGDGNRSGPPDEVYVFRPGVSPASDGRLSLAALSADKGRTVINEDTDPSIHLQNSTPATLRVFDVGQMGDSITFKICLAPPGCGASVCGTDGCGGFCGSCEANNYCVEGACVPCSCNNKTCGDNGCGVSCGECDDQNPCTVDACVDGNCTFTAATGEACDDEDVCTSMDSCTSDGACQGSAFTCEPGACETTSECDGEGGCTVTLRDAGTACDDGNVCTSDDRCDDAGGCTGTAYTCKPAVCQSASECDGNGGCSITLRAAGAVCDDDDPETADDQCTDSGVCFGTVPPTIKADGGCQATNGDSASGLPLMLISMVLILLWYHSRFRVTH
jgi:M6 family metalloprotease-like protein